ncbi:MAG: ABC transporter permease [Lachnospiraceae bacterium]|nr:ABC transporter permease [Lachnospiraceae bacterium]
MKMVKEKFWDYRFLLMELIKKGIKLKYRRSYLGILWSLLEPILTTIVLTIVFGTLFGRGDDRTFPVYILSGRLLFSYFSTSTTAALKSIRANQSMIKKVYVPKYLYPLSAILFNFIIFLISLVVIAGTMMLFDVKPTWYLLQIVVPLLNLLILTVGAGMIMATVGVFFRDMEYLWNVCTMLIMYASAIFYDAATILKSDYAIMLKANPLYCIIMNFRQAIFGQAMDGKMLAYSTVFAVLSVIVGAVLFHKKENEFILHI